MGIWAQSKAAVQSALRQLASLPSFTQPFDTEYRLDSARVDVKLARSLYNNTEPRYKLGAGFSRPAINVPVGFMGVPIMKVAKGSNDTDEAQDWLDRLVSQWTGSVIDIHQAVLRDGEALVRVRPANRSPAYARLFGSEDRDLELTYEPSEAFEVLHMDEDFGAVTGIRVKHVFYVNQGGQTVEKVMYETMTASEIKYEYPDKYRPTRTQSNPLGFVPAVHIKNESEKNHLHGRSELEPLEPYMRFYNDVMLQAGSASKLHSTAKLILTVQDVENFLTNNFDEAEVQSGRLRFKDKDVLFFETGAPEIGVTGASAYQEGAEIIQASAPLGDTNTLLEYIFLNIVDVSEVPEWAFGGAIASSKASVSEQSAPLVHKVNRKRSLFENYWALIGRMGLSMLNVSARVEVTWDDLAQRDTQSEAEALKSLTDALISLNDAEMISKVSAVEELRPFLKKVLPYAVKDKRTEEELLESEVEETARSILAQFQASQEEEEVDEQDREAGLRAVR